MLDLFRLLEQTRAELARRRAVVAKEERLPALPRPKTRQENDAYRELDRWIRKKHAAAKLCKYVECRGKNCPRWTRT